MNRKILGITVVTLVAWAIIAGMVGFVIRLTAAPIYAEDTPVPTASFDDRFHFDAAANLQEACGSRDVPAWVQTVCPQ